MDRINNHKNIQFCPHRGEKGPEIIIGLLNYLKPNQNFFAT